MKVKYLGLPLDLVQSVRCDPWGGGEGHSHTKVVYMLVTAPQKWTLKWRNQYRNISPLNGVSKDPLMDPLNSKNNPIIIVQHTYLESKNPREKSSKCARWNLIETYFGWKVTLNFVT